jgi:hypothetical protein
VSRLSPYWTEAILPSFAPQWMTGSAGKMVYSLPHDVRRRAISLARPKAFRELQALRHVETTEGYSYKPFDDRQCIFVHVPKAAGISICKTLFGNLAGGHTGIGIYQIVFSKDEFERYFKFAFVRNPWSRLLSAYQFLKSGGMDADDERWAVEQLADFDTFDDFVRGWVTPDSILTQIHLVPQYQLLCLPFTQTLAVDFVGYFEHLDRDYAFICERLGLKTQAKLPRHNIGPSGDSRSYRDHYTPSTISIVAEAYKDDIALFRYNFESG